MIRFDAFGNKYNEEMLVLYRQLLLELNKKLAQIREKKS